MNLSLNPSLLPTVVLRACDSEPLVRVAVYHKLVTDMVDLNYFTMDQRIYLLKNGLSDRNAMVRKSCLKLLFESWMKQLENNVLEFLQGIPMMQDTDTAHECLKAFFMCQAQLDFSFHGDSFYFYFIDSFWNQLNPEKAFFIFAYTTYCKEHQVGLNISKALEIR